MYISSGWCLLFTVQTTCPSGWVYYDGEVITSVDELDGYPDRTYSGCYAKGKTKVVLNMREQYTFLLLVNIKNKTLI